MEGEGGVEPNPQPAGGIWSEVDHLVPNPDSPLTASVLALPREEDRLRFGRFEANGVALGPVKAGSGALLQLVGHIIDVVALDDPSDVVTKEMPRQSSTWLSTAWWISAM